MFRRDFLRLIGLLGVGVLIPINLSANNESNFIYCKIEADKLKETEYFKVPNNRLEEFNKKFVEYKEFYKKEWDGVKVSISQNRIDNIEPTQILLEIDSKLDGVYYHKIEKQIKI